MMKDQLCIRTVILSILQTSLDEFRFSKRDQFCSSILPFCILRLGHITFAAVQLCLEPVGVLGMCQPYTFTFV